jgi:hypothetical protein
VRYVVTAKVLANVAIYIDADTEDEAKNAAMTRLNEGEEDVWDRATEFEATFTGIEPD